MINFQRVKNTGIVIGYFPQHLSPAPPPGGRGWIRNVRKNSFTRGLEKKTEI
jgi:hypothetical protein